jgi:MFS family permease
MTTSTQQAHPVRASRRTAVQNALSVILVVGLVAPIVAGILSEELGEHLPESWLAWVVGAAAVLAAVSAALARIMAIPAVDAWLRHLGLSSMPAHATVTSDGAHVITTLTVDERQVINDLRAIEGRPPLDRT